MIESFKKVIKSLILPKYNEIVSFKIETHDTIYDVQAVFVVYVITKELETKRARDLTDDTASLFRMIGFPKEYQLYFG